ncbi:MAG: hypothetical protein HYV68_01195 [Candidatus Taylorbacteria bacterium]|nr:hypothetical protein [Candidatus Taylorbacteria bacterium]
MEKHRYPPAGGFLELVPSNSLVFSTRAAHSSPSSRVLDSVEEKRK